MELQLYGHGGAITSDSYFGVRYYPKDHKAVSLAGYAQKVVASLDDDTLPSDSGLVATGLYVVRIEPEWFVYRFEYRE